MEILDCVSAVQAALPYTGSEDLIEIGAGAHATKAADATEFTIQ